MSSPASPAPGAYAQIFQSAAATSSPSVSSASIKRPDPFDNTPLFSETRPLKSKQKDPESPRSPRPDPDSYVNYATPEMAPTPPPAATSWISRIKEALTPTVPVRAELSSEDRTLMGRIADVGSSISTMPERLVSSLKGSFGNFDLSKYHPRLSELICILSDVTVMTLSSDPLIAVAMQPRMLLQYGWLTTAIIDGLSLLVKQFMKRMERPVDQGDKEDESQNESALGALLSAVHYYTLGRLPDLVPRDILKTLIVANASFAFVKSVEHFGPYIVRALKTCVNAVWRLAFGVNYFDSEQLATIESIALATIKLNNILSLKAQDRAAVANFRVALQDSKKLLALGTAQDVGKELLERFEKLINRAAAVLTSEAFEAQIHDPRPIPVVSMIIGEPSKGKSLLVNAVCAALGKACGYRGTPKDFTVYYQKGVNFQAPLSPGHKVLVFDDALLVTDNNAHSEFLSLLGDLGSPVPLLQDAPGVLEKGSMYLGPEYVLQTENPFSSQLPVSNREAPARRYTGGMHNIEVTSEYTNAQGHLDFSALAKYAKEAGAAKAFDAAFVLTDHAGVKRNFTSYVSMLYTQRNISLDKARSANFMNDDLLSNFQVVDKVTISTVPTDFPGTKVQSKKLSTFYQIGGDSDSSSDEKFADTVDQALQMNGTIAEFDQWLFSNGPVDPVVSSRVRSYLNRHSSKFTFDKEHGVMSNGQAIQPGRFRDYVVIGKKEPAVDINVEPKKWTLPVIHAMKTEKFFVKEGCLRHGDYCYRHGSDSICACWDDDAVEVDFPGVAHWACQNVDRSPTNLDYLAIVRDSQPVMVNAPQYAILKTFAMAFAAATFGWAIGMFLNKLYGWYWSARDHSAYGTMGARHAKRDPQQELPRSSIGQAKDHAGDDGERPTDWLLRKLEGNVIPVETTNGVRKISLNILGLIGNIAVMNRHAAAPGFNVIRVGGPFAQTLDLKVVSDPLELKDSIDVQFVPDNNMDVGFLILPKAFKPFKSVVKYLVRAGTTLPSLRGMVMGRRRPTPVTDVDGNVKPVVLEPLSPFPLGDVSGAHSYQTSAHYQGVYVKVQTPTVPGECGSPIFTTNTRVGRGHEILAGVLTAYNEASGECIMVPTIKEDVEAFIAMCPPSVLNLVQVHSAIQLETAPPHNLPPNVLVAGAVPKTDTQYQNMKNTIRYAPDGVVNCLAGLKIHNPVSGKMEEVPPINVAPAPIHDIPASLLKVRATSSVPDKYVFELYKESIKEVEEHVLKFADPRLLQVRSEPFSWDEAINGVPEFNILGLDMTKSPGYHPGHKPGHQGRSYYAEQDTKGAWHLKSSILAYAEKIFSDILKGKLPTAYVVANTKLELRTVGKAARQTSCYGFILLCAMRRLSLHVPAMFITGRIRNGVSFGADLNGSDGREVASASDAFSYVTSADAKNYDASKSAYFAQPNEEMIARLIRRTMPFLSFEAAVIVPMLSRIVNVVCGSLVWIMWHSMQSGHPLTTVLNCSDSSAVGRTAYKLSDPPEDQPFDTHVFSLAYGDDFRAAHNHPKFTNIQFAKTGAALGIEYTPVQKGAAVFADFVDHEDDVHLKRGYWRDQAGMYHWPLQLQTVSHIHAFYHKNDFSPQEAVRQNCEAALMEWFHYGPSVFNTVRDRINDALAREGIPVVTHTYSDLYVKWFRNQGHSAITLLRRPVDHGTLASVRSTTDFRAGGVDHSSISPNKDTEEVDKVNKQSATPTSRTDAVVSQHKLTRYEDDNTLATVDSTSALRSQALTRLNPYPKLGVEDILGREYPLETLTWNRADSAGTRVWHTDFPETCFAIPKLSETLSTLRFARFGLQLTFRVNGNQFVGGALVAAVIPYMEDGEATEAWRSDHNLICNSPGVIISAGKSEAVSLITRWMNPKTWYNIPDQSPRGAIGSLYVDILTPQVWMSASPPNSLSVNVYARFIDIQVAGYDDNPPPTLGGVRGKLGKKGGKHTDQSAISEAIDKATSQALSVAPKPIQALVGVASELLPVLGALDKPSEVTTTQPVRYVMARDHVQTEGVSEAPVYAGPVNAYVSVDNKMLLEASPKPTWDNVLTIPGVVDRISWPPATAAGAVLGNWFINPSMAYNVNTGPGGTVYAPIPLAYFAQHFRHWHGGFKFKLRLFSPASQKGTIRVSYLPSFSSSAAVSDGAVGDVQTGVYDVCGDKDIDIEIPFLAEYAQLFVPPIGDTNPPNSTNCIGRLVVQVVNPLTSQLTPNTATVYGVLYASAAPGFVLESPQRFPANASIVLSSTIGNVRKTTSVSSGGEVDHASVQTEFGRPFPTLSKATPVTHSGVVDPDKTRGPIELAKRYVEIFNVSSGPITVIAEPYGFLRTFLSCWKSFSGGVSYRLLPFIGAYPGAWDAIVRLHKLSSTALTTPDNGYGSNLSYFLGNDPVVSVTLPYSALTPATPFYGTIPHSAITYYFETPTSFDNAFDVWQAVSDDFCLYHFIACPFVLVSSTSVKKSAQPARTPKVARPNPRSTQIEETH